MMTKLSYFLDRRDVETIRENLVASVDALEARSDKLFQRSNDRAMGKVQALWNAVNKSAKTNDIVKEITGKTFIQPTITRWNSEYYDVQRVVEIGIEKMNVCQSALGLSTTTEDDKNF